MQSKTGAITSHPLGWLLLQTHRKQQALAVMWRNWNPCVRLVGMENDAVAVGTSRAVL